MCAPELEALSWDSPKLTPVGQLTLYRKVSLGSTGSAAGAVSASRRKGEMRFSFVTLVTSSGNSGNGLAQRFGRALRTPTNSIIQIQRLGSGLFPTKQGRALRPQALHTQAQFRIEQHVADASD